MSQSPKQKKTSGARLQQTGKKNAMSRKKKELLVMDLMIVLAVLMVCAAAVAVFFNRWVVKPDLPSADNSPSPSLSAPVGGDSTASPDPSETPSEPEYDPVQPKVSGERISEDVYSILVFGADESSNLTDTIMVVTYNVTNQMATAMSIPRDTITNSRGVGVDAKKINAVYARAGGGEKGINALMDEVSELVGFSIDYYVMVNWELVGMMVDAIGGVYFDVPWDMWYSDPYQDLYIDLQEGYQLLNGDQAMQLVRWRKNMNKKTFSTKGEKSVGDTGRLEIQQNFLKEVLKQTLQLKNATRVSELSKLFGENVVSNLTVENLFWFGSQAIFSGLSVDNVRFVTMPFYYGEYPVQHGEKWEKRSFVYPARKDLLSLINGALNPFVDEVSIREVDLVYVNENGGLSTTSGSLVDQSMATLPEEYLLWKELQENPDAATDPDGEEDSDGEVDAENPDEPTGNEDPDVTGEPNGDAQPAVTDDPQPEESGDPVSDSGDSEPEPSAQPDETGEPEI